MAQYFYVLVFNGYKLGICDSKNYDDLRIAFNHLIKNNFSTFNTFTMCSCTDDCITTRNVVIDVSKVLVFFEVNKDEFIHIFGEDEFSKYINTKKCDTDCEVECNG